MLDATQLRNWSGVGGGDDNIPCTCTDVGCYATGQGWVGGMVIFLALAHMLDATQLVRGGWGGDGNIPCTCTHVGCYATGQGWVGDDNIPCACTHVGCYATGQGWVGGGMITFLALARMLDATQLVRGGWGGDGNIPCTCTHVGCYATGQGWVGWGDDNIPCTCTHVGCYATGQGWVGGGMITFLALAHMLDATQLVRHSMCGSFVAKPEAIFAT